MALSEEERRILEQMEHQLRRDDPYLVSTMNHRYAVPGENEGAASADNVAIVRPPRSARKVGWGVAAFLTGLVCPLVGISTGNMWGAVALGVVGFALMVVGVLLIVQPTRGTSSSTNATANDSHRPSSSPHSSRWEAMMRRQDERWDERRRREGRGD